MEKYFDKLELDVVHVQIEIYYLNKRLVTYWFLLIWNNLSFSWKIGNTYDAIGEVGLQFRKDLTAFEIHVSGVSNF